ncbi:MAG: Cleavage stimulation factor subunit 3 [Pycnora praestabilis]|nr:MAG: Cleavage stimulation factor subunit 3 [Pycnora praestabilis]
MAETDAETAFLNSMREMNETAGSLGADNDTGTEQNGSQSSEDYDPSQPVKEYSSTPYEVDLGNAVQVPPSPSDTSSYDPARPSSILHQAAGVNSPSNGLNNIKDRAVTNSMSHDQSRSASRASIQYTGNASGPSNLPRTIGGFIVDDEDSEGEEDIGSLQTATGTSNGLMSGVSANTPQRSVSHTPSNAISTHYVSIPNAAEDQGAQGVVQNGANHIVPNLAAVIPEIGASTNDDSTDKPSRPFPAPQVIATEISSSTAETPNTAVSKARLPHDRVGILEDRIREDPRGDMDAWLSLISEYRKRDKFDDARNVYDRFFKIFPSAAEQWIAYANMELQNNDFWRVEQIFSKSLLTIPNIQLWSLYLDYVRRRNNLTDATSNARTIVNEAYEFVLQNIGVDKDSGAIWQDYVQFIRSYPGNIGGNSWQDQQKMDLLRKAYQRAICVPMQAVNTLWKEYDTFELGLNKMTGRKFLQEKSPAYMSARSSFTQLQNITRDLHRTTLPILPPALGFEGDLEYLQQIDIWKKWLQWEKDDPLVLKDEDLAAYHGRILYVFKQAVMALRFWPEMWFDASEYCYQNGLEKEGDDFLTKGVAANPESCLLAFKHADRLESTTLNEEGEESAKRRGIAVREPYDKVLDALYELIVKSKSRETKNVARIEEYFSNNSNLSFNGLRGIEDDEDEMEDTSNEAKEAAKKSQLEAVQNGSAVQIRLLSRTVSFVWIALMRAMRRVQGKGKVGDPIGGSRQIFTDARKRGRLTSDVYVASALIEYHCYKDPAATKIFERGMKLFPEDENFALEYLKHLIAINDITSGSPSIPICSHSSNAFTDARAVFETTVSKLAQKSETLRKAKPIYVFFHEYESHYGELNQVSKLEKRMSDLFPEDPQLLHFARRYTTQGFDPTAIRPIISPATQARPKSLMPSIETAQPLPDTPPKRFVQTNNSPKRPLPGDESENDTTRPRKLARGESPLKGAAGRRLDQQKRQRQRNDFPDILAQRSTPGAPPPLLPREVLFLLSIIPKAETYEATRFKPEEMVRLLREINLPTSVPQVRPPQTSLSIQQGQVNGGYPTSTSTSSSFIRSFPMSREEQISNAIREQLARYE